MKQILDLKIGEKYTIVRYSDLGFLFSVQLTVQKTDTVPWAQYAETVILWYRKKFERKPKGMRFCPRDQFLVFSGWVEVNTDMWVEKGTSGAGFATKKSLPSFSQEYLKRALASVPAKPLHQLIDPPLSELGATISEREV